jgi:Ca-activated chloride channel homolog
MGIEYSRLLLLIPPVAGLIVLMYILKLRRKDVVVSSTFLWAQVVRDVQANSPFQKLRKNLLLLLQLLIALFVIFALTRPFFRSTTIGGRNIVLLLDTSASMQATDIAPSRMDAAKQLARKLIDTLKPGDRMMIMAAGARPKPKTGFTSERPQLLRALDEVQAADTSAAMRDAINLSADLVASRKDGSVGRIELISDGGFLTANSTGTPQALTGLNLGDTHLEYHAVGKGGDNVGIVAVDIRRNLGRQKSVQLLVVTHNFSPKPQTFTQEIYAGEDIIDAGEVTLDANGEQTETYNIPEQTKPVNLRVKLDIRDALEADNQAAVVLKPRKELNVLLVSPENIFLENALNVDPSVTVTRAEKWSKGGNYDVTVFADDAPPKLPPGNYLFLHCSSDAAPVKTSGSLENVAPADWDKEHPVLRFVDFGNDRFGKALKATPQSWGKEIASAESGSLIVIGERGKNRALFFGFDINESLFPLRVAFPILISNSVHWLGGSAESQSGQIPAGSSLTLPAPAGIGKITVTRPNGDKRDLLVSERGGAAFDETELVGIYTAQGKEFAYTFAANLANTGESDLTPHPTLPLSDNPNEKPGKRVPDNHPLLPYLVALALGILALEWWAFHRRVYLN